MTANGAPNSVAGKMLAVNINLEGIAKAANDVASRIRSVAKTTKPDFTQIAPKYTVGENFTVNHIYNGYTNVEHNTIDYDSQFTYNENTKQWEAPTEYETVSYMTFSINENKENMAICYDSGLNGNENSYIYFFKNDKYYYTEKNGGQSCIKIGDITTTDTLSFESYSGEDDPNLNKFNFYLVDDYTANDTNSGVYIADDDYGKSYYFRGDIENNYVKFGDFYWRIIRLNGDGTLRIAYDGTTPHKNGEASTDRALSTSKFNESYSKNALVGYMYGDINATEYSKVHANTNNSTIKTYLDSWYETNIRDKGLSKYVSDTLFCNDRSVTSGTGIGTTVTHYGAYTRANTDADPILTCPQKNDAFTVDDTEKGNGALTYPIGLLTADEFRLAGEKLRAYTVNNYINKPGVSWWFGSPCTQGSEFAVYEDGFLDNIDVPDAQAVVPVINLTAEYTQQLKGSGTMQDPYHF